MSFSAADCAKQPMMDIEQDDITQVAFFQEIPDEILSQILLEILNPANFAAQTEHEKCNRVQAFKVLLYGNKVMYKKISGKPLIDILEIAREKFAISLHKSYIQSVCPAKRVQLFNNLFTYKSLKDQTKEALLAVDPTLNRLSNDGPLGRSKVACITLIAPFAASCLIGTVVYRGLSYMYDCTLEQSECIEYAFFPGFASGIGFALGYSFILLFWHCFEEPIRNW